MKGYIAGLSLLLLGAFSAPAQGYVIFSSSGQNISTNSVFNGAATGKTSGGAGAFCYALYYSTTATTVNGQTAAIVGNTSSAYAFNDSNWKLAGYGVSTATSGRFTSINQNTDGTITIPGIAGGSTAQFAVIGWSANIGTNIAAVTDWFNYPVPNGWIGQSAVSGPIQTGNGGSLPASPIFGASAPLIRAFVLGLILGGFEPPAITSSATNQITTIGGTASFTVTGYGDAGLPLTGQWLLNGTNMNAGGNYSVTGTNYFDNIYFVHRGIFTLTVTNAQLTNAGNYSVSLSNGAGTAISTNALLTVLTGPPGTPPTIISQPVDATVIAGGSTNFSVSVTGASPLGYQWSLNGTNLLNATNATLILSGVLPVNAGNYSVSITNAYGATNSVAAVLTVQTFPPVIAVQPSSAWVQAGSAVQFIVTATGTKPLSYQWSFNGTNVANATGASNWVYNVQAANAGNYSVTITNISGAVTSSIAVLTIVPPSGYIIFSSGPYSGAKIFTNSVVGGPATGLTVTNPGQYVYALFVSATATNVNGNSQAILGNNFNGFAFNDPAWSLVAYGINNLTIPGRLNAVGTDANGETSVVGFDPGSSAQFVVIGWSANIGPDIDSVETWFNGGNPAADGWIGQSAVSRTIQLGGSLYPPLSLFGAPPGSQGFTLGLAPAAVNGHIAYAVPVTAPLILQASMSGKILKLSWPLAAGSYGVQSASSTTGPWSDSGLTVSNDGTTASVTVPTTGQSQYFRLTVQ